MKKVMLSALLLSLPLMGYAQESFSTPEAAANAFAAAVAGRNETQLTALLGDDWRQFLPPEGADPEAVARFNRDWREGHQIVQKDNTAHLNVGREGWQLPMPMVKEAEGWRFDMVVAQDEILTRTIGRNELSTLQAMHAYVDAQQDYYLQNHRWAHRIISSEGQKDGLYWPVKAGEAPSPLGPNFSPAAPDKGYHGYYFRIISDKDGHGAALLAWPMHYGETGVMSFMVNQDDRIYQADLGKNTENNVQAITRFAPDAQWKVAE